jgi:hypothetical protein
MTNLLKELLMKSNKLYDQIDIPIFYANELAIPFNPTWKNIAINLSGGADSALLAFILCDFISKNKLNCMVHVITYHRCWKTRPWQIDISLMVFDKIKEMFPTVEFKRHIGYIPPELEWGSIGPIHTDVTGRQRSGDQITVSSYNDYMIFQQGLEAVFEATTRNPDVNFEGKMPNREKSLDDAVLRDLVIEKDNSYIISPFRFVRKDWIVFQYKQQSAMNLYVSTRSCEGEFEDITYKNYIPGQYVPICNNCFWCKERAWAEGKNE